MDLVDAIRARRSVRVFREDPIARSTVNELLELAALAPSPQNIQPWRFHVAMGPARDRVCEVVARTTQYLQEYVDALGEEEVERAARFYANLGGAPVVIGISSPRVPAHEVDGLNMCLGVGACIENLLLAATDRGLGACNITVPHWVADDVLAVFSVPDDRQLMSLVIIGKPDEVPVRRAYATGLVSYLQ